VKTLLDAARLRITLRRLAHQLMEDGGEAPVVVGLQPRGAALAERLVAILREEGHPPAHYGTLDITFYRDDLRQGGVHLPAQTSIDFSVESKRVVLVDDVLHTGRTVRAALDALVDFGRPLAVELLVLIDRRFARELPIQPDYVGQAVDTVDSQRVKVLWQEVDGCDEVVLLDPIIAQKTETV